MLQLLTLLQAPALVFSRPPVEGWGSVLEGLQNSLPASDPVPTSGRPSWASRPSPPSPPLSPHGMARPRIPNIPNISPGLSTWQTSSIMPPSIPGVQGGSLQIPNMKPVSIPNINPSTSETPSFSPMIPNQRPRRPSRAGALSFSYDTSGEKSRLNRWQGGQFPGDASQSQFPRDPRQTQFPPTRSRAQSAAQNPWMVPQQQHHPYNPFPIPLRRNHSAIPNLARLRLPTKPELPLTGGGPCVTAKGLVGKCATEQKCRAARGTPSGNCPQGPQAVCCTFAERCGAVTAQEVTYLRSPGYPSLASQQADCEVTVRLQNNACQLRLDFLDFELAPPRDGVCSPQDRLLITSNQRQAFIPVSEFCGRVAETPVDPTRSDLPHIYVHVDDRHPERSDATAPNSSPLRTVTLNMKARHSAKWNIRVDQIDCDGGDLQAPAGCGQYFTEPSGNISSLNWRDGTYLKDKNVASCIKPDLEACAIQYTINGMGLGLFRGNKLGYGLACSDHLAFHGEKTGVCGSVVTPRQMTLPSTSLTGFTLSTDGNHKDKQDVGFSLSYRMVKGNDCKGLQFYKYPNLPSSRA